MRIRGGVGKHYRGIARGYPNPFKKKYKAKTTYSIYNIHSAH